MSGGDRNRKKAPRAQGWEEAGAEFYQESYPSTDTDFDVLQKDPKQLATLLPSKQNRAATIKRIRTSTDTKTFRRQTSSRSRRESTTRRASTAADVQVSMLPDLSENLSNEQRTWEEIMQIKALPVSMAQKREMKAKLQSEPNLRLQGFEQFKWKRRKIWQKLEAQIKESYAKLELWKSDLKRIEGNCGTGVVAYFLFIKWLLFLNFGIFGLVFLFVTLPTLIFNKQEDTECEDCCSAMYFNQSTDSNIILDLVQGTGRMERTILFYGVYSNETFSYSINDTLMYYDLPLAYITVTLVYFILSLIAIVKSAAKDFKERLVEGEGQFYQYCNLIFGGWDFCIHNEKTAVMKHKAIYNEIKGFIEVERREEERQNRTQQERTKLIIIRFIVNLVVLCVLAASAAAIYFVFAYSTNKLEESPEDIPFLDSSMEKLLYEFLPSISIVLLNILVPMIFGFLVNAEKYSPVNVIRITLVRTVFLRLSSLFVLYASLYAKVSCEPENSEICLSANCTTCWETFVGQQIYKLVLTDFATHLFLTFFINLPRAIIAKNFNNKFAKFIGQQNFELPKHVLDVIYSQTLCWLGCFYAPLLPAIATVVCFLMFYVKKFACLINSTPGVTIYRASRSNSMFMIVLLLSYIFAILPVAYSIGELFPSRSCGPFRGLPSVWSYIVIVFTSTPKWLQCVVAFISTAGFAVPAFVVLTLLLYYYWAVNSANRHMVTVLKNQLVLEGHDKQFLLDRLSMFIKQQQESQKRLRHAEMIRDGERNISSN
ncbi:hypothetical protein ILUMI_23589 [Ignelater luminosus]|uniref:TMC domain-containing protein n=1 Tax=Ignelater luminosus TaxID=2038154 RepID=A0A8K0CC59_IGNLU|nr:hypothetical protein ILUMI_23589 [Ignelater luminosus]